MDIYNLNTILFAGKWAFIGLVYLILMLVVISVRREIASQTVTRGPVQAIAPGRLTVINPGQDQRIRQGNSIPLKSTTFLGAGVENDIVLGDGYISARHARLTWDGSAWWVEDLNSSNGTRLNGTVCPPLIPIRVGPGARLELGGMIFELNA